MKTSQFLILSAITLLAPHVSVGVAFVLAVTDAILAVLFIIAGA